MKTTPTRYTRTDINDPDCHEVLTIVQLDGRDDLCVEICAGPGIGDDFIGLYDLDGDAIQLGNATWTAVKAPAEAVRAVEENFQNGGHVLVPIEAT